MIAANNVSLTFGERNLFKEVNIKFLPGNCYGLIGANGAGKSTFVKILSGELEPTSGRVEVGRGERIAVLTQDQFRYDAFVVLETVIMGHKRMYEIMQEREAIYSKADFTEEDGNRAADLEGEFAELGGYEAEYEASSLLNSIGIDESLQGKQMSELEAGQKVRVLLAQAIFGTPDILLLDEPTNQLDIQTIRWLENFLANFENTVIVVSHDRHFLNNVCTHTADLDFGKIRLYVGNYDWWYRASQLIAKHRKEQSKRRDAKVAELKTFVQRFSSNRSKAKQATSRKKLIEKLTLEDLPQTSRKFPYVAFDPERPAGRTILRVEQLTKTIEGETLFKNLNLTIEKGDKIALLGPNDLQKTVFFQILMGEDSADSGIVHWGQTIKPGYLPKENSSYFDTNMSLVEWLRQYTSSDDETFIRGFLGRMLFTGEEALKPAHVLSGGEKVRCMLSRMMLMGCNTLVLDEPTNHLDLEAIMSLNDGLVAYSEPLIFTSQDFEFVNTVANRLIEIAPHGVIDRRMSYADYIEDENVKAIREEMYAGHRVPSY
ncbi:MAG: ABC-F family ATP-binding cassette domain-containing protein [Candidatus Promineifilaceae bacterium]